MKSLLSIQGFVFESHIPARFIQQFSKSLPEAATGQSVPGMPVDSPGMEMDDTFIPYKIRLLKQEGSAEIFASVGSTDQQLKGSR